MNRQEKGDHTVAAVHRMERLLVVTGRVVCTVNEHVRKVELAHFGIDSLRYVCRIVVHIQHHHTVITVQMVSEQMLSGGRDLCA